MREIPEAAAPAQPLFYRDPQPLSAAAHAGWRVGAGDMGFAADAGHVPIVATEFAAAARDYPIVFAAGSGAPMAVLGLGRSNLFVAQARWEEGRYVPAYVRRYPFGFIAADAPGRFALAIDAAAEQVAQAGDTGTALFEQGAPSELTRRALAFCDAFNGEAMATRAFVDGLRDADLLIERRADAALGDGRRFDLHGFRIVDPEKFAALPDAHVADWHRKGWLGLVHHHLTSLDRFEGLLARQLKRPAGAGEREYAS